LSKNTRPICINTDKVINIGSNTFLRDFLILPSWTDSSPIWNKFVLLINPEDESDTKTLPIRLTSESEMDYYVPCHGFDLTGPLADWLSWDLLTTADGQLAQILKVKEGTNISDPTLNTVISCPFKNSHLPKMNSLPRANGSSSNLPQNNGYGNRGGKSNNFRERGGRGRRNTYYEEQNPTPAPVTTIQAPPQIQYVQQPMYQQPGWGFNGQMQPQQYGNNFPFQQNTPAFNQMPQGQFQNQGMPQQIQTQPQNQIMPK